MFALEALLRFPLEGKAYDMVLAVPINPKQLLERGYNQALVVGQELAKGWGITVSDKLILRKARSQSQTRQTGQERRLNARQMFSLNPKASAALRGKRILLVDDVLTTGSTLLALLDLLEAEQVQSVDVLTIAVTI